MNSIKRIINSQTFNAENRRRRMARRRGSIFVIALGVMAVLAALIIVYAQNMRTEAILAGNRVAYLQADAIERAAEQYVLAECDTWGTSTENDTGNGVVATAGDAVDLMAEPGEAVSVGTGYFFLLQPSQEDDQTFVFGICDESSKLNINYANANELMTLSSQMNQDQADSIVAWRTSSTSTAIASDANTESYYDALQEPYDCKNAPYESVEELMLVAGQSGPITPSMLFGYDLNRNYVISEAEGQNSLMTQNLASGTDDRRGIFDYLTAYTPKAAAAAAGGRTGGGAAATPTAQVNINTAPELTFMALGLSQEDADNIITNREGNWVTSSTLATFLAGLSLSTPTNTLTPLLTTTSYQYSADILAVTGDGHGFKRVRIVVDSTNAPSKIVYRKDLTSLGFPLIPQLRQALRQGAELSEGSSGANDSPDQQFGAGR